jgi:hypothetical protein
MVFVALLGLLVYNKRFEYTIAIVYFYSNRSQQSLYSALFCNVVIHASPPQERILPKKKGNKPEQQIASSVHTAITAFTHLPYLFASAPTQA